jgi:hypothetical protein
VESVKEYSQKANSLDLAGFVHAYPEPVFIKHPKRPRPGDPAEPDFGFETVQFTLHFDPLAILMQLAPIKKRPGNPFPDRISIGRAPNCDVVLRLPFVSKVHAHLMLQPGGKFLLRDNNASNGTIKNGRRVEPGESCPVSFGDILEFGSLALELADAARLYQVLRNEAAKPKP